ncbi:Protein-lysine N-methyltransferase efm4 [Lecanora helva]
MPPPDPPNLPPSSLGTKTFWDTTYIHDLTLSTTTPTHTGQDWFSDSAASQKILSYLSSPSFPSPNNPLSKTSTTFLDLGTGNGEMLFLLREAGWRGKMVGVDYSGGSVEFCRRRIGERVRVQGEEEGEEIVFEEWDIIQDEPRGEWEGGFDVVLDKGTFDAVSLNEEVDARGRRVVEGYRERVERLVKRGGVMVVTSCNWTEEELRGWFEGEEGEGEGKLVMVGRVEYPVFRFGGHTGQSISTVCFRKED